MNEETLLTEEPSGGGGDQAEISSFFVSSASSSLSAPRGLHPRQQPRRSAAPPDDDDHRRRQRLLSAGLFAARSRDPLEDDSLRVSSSTLFQSSTAASSSFLPDSPSSNSTSPALNDDDRRSSSPAKDRGGHHHRDERQRGSHDPQFPNASASGVDSSTSYHLLPATPEGRLVGEQANDQRGAFSNRGNCHVLPHPHFGEGMPSSGAAQEGDRHGDYRNRQGPLDDCDACWRWCDPAPGTGAARGADPFLGGGGGAGPCGDGGLFAPRLFKQRIADTLLERMRSRADVDAAVGVALAGAASATAAADAAALDEKKVSSPMAILDEAEARMIRNTALARKRVRVAQLLMVGLLALLLGWLGNFFVTSSCHFASSTVTVGQSDEPFELHYGLWKYSTVDSAISGSSNCYPYHSAQHRAPVVSRVANLLALLLGTYSQGCVWTYLITGQWHPKLWQAAVQASVVAGVLQLLTLCFFAERVCRASQNRCGMGPASVVAIVTAVVWLVFAWEVHYNTPRGTEAMIASLEMRDLRRASAEFMTRFQPENLAEYRPPELMQGSVYA